MEIKYNESTDLRLKGVRLMDVLLVSIGKAIKSGGYMAHGIYLSNT